MRSKSLNSQQTKQNHQLLTQVNYLYTRAIMWQTLLKVNYNINYPIENVLLIQNNQRVIKFDVLRTRGYLLDQELKINLEKLLTFFVQENQINYKQGLHEIAAPFIIFLKAAVPLSNIYQMFNEFIKKYMTNFFDDDFNGIQCILYSHTILLKYHDMELYNKLIQYEFTAELYAIPWFITLFISKSDFKIAQMIIENTILIDDKYFIFSFNIAVLIFNKNEILQKKADSLPQFISKIYLNDENQYIQILKIALKIHTYTPKSFWNQLNNLNLFNHHVKPIFNQINNSQLEILSISPQEVKEMISQYTLITEKWKIQNINHPQVQKLQEIFKKQIYKPQQPVLIFNNLQEQLKQKILQNCLIHIIDLAINQKEKILKQLFNFKITNKLWICFIINDSNQFQSLYDSLCQENTRFVSKCNFDEFFEFFMNNNN